jgi:hypothetical protein
MQRISNTPLMQISTFVMLLMLRRFDWTSSLAYDVLCRDGKAALIWAADNGHDSTVGLLLEHHADVNAADK